MRMEKTTNPKSISNKQPVGLTYLFFAEMWERFSFYGLRALLILYMTSQLSFSDEKSYGVYAAYFTLVYLSTLLGGVVADKILGNRKAIICGGILITLGHTFLSFAELNQAFFFAGLGFIVGGTGLFKTNISSLLGQLYSKDDPRRDAGFTFFYVGINVGGLLAPLICGYIGEAWGWHYGFGIASIGMLAGLITFMKGCKHFEGAGLQPQNALTTSKSLGALSAEQLTYIASFLSVPIFTFILMQYNWFEMALPAIGAIFGLYSLYLIKEHKGPERRALIAIFTLMFFQTGFFAVFEQAGSSISLFTERNVNREVFGYLIPTSMFQSINSLFIITLGPVFAKIWSYARGRNKDPNPAYKFAMALFQVSLGFGALYLGTQSANDQAQSSAIWIVLAYLLHSTGELCIMPVGLSMVTRLSPKKILNTMMGLWFVSLAFSEYLAGLFAKITAVEHINGVVDTQASLQAYGNAFYIATVFALAMAILLSCLSPLIKKNF